MSLRNTEGAIAIASYNDQHKIFVNCGELTGEPKSGSIAIFTLKANDRNGFNLVKIEKINCLDIVGSFYSAKGIIINNEFHIIDAREGKHIKYDPESEKVTVLHHLERKTKIGSAGIVEMRDKILILGGFGWGFPYTDEIHQYNVKSNIWTQLNYKLPRKMAHFGATMILNGQYMALFGGCNDDGLLDEIYLHSVHDNTFQESNMFEMYRLWGV